MSAMFTVGLGTWMPRFFIVSMMICEIARLRNHLRSQVIRLADFPSSCWVIEPPLETVQLLFLADMQKKFQNVRVVRNEASLEVVDLLVALRPDLFWDQ